MSGFSDIVGQEHIVSHLKKAVSSGKVSHAYMIDGPKLSGKLAIADAFAMLLQCERRHADSFSGREIEPCMKCSSCVRALGNNHPDIIHVVHEKQNTLSVEEIRDQVNRDIYIKPYAGPYKIYIIEDAEKMNPQAQNALLKTLEEPPSYAVIILLTANSSVFLPTVRSRCVSLKIRPVPPPVIKQHLMKNCSVPDYQADICVRFSMGNPGRAAALAVSQGFAQMKEAAVRFAVCIADPHKNDGERLLSGIPDPEDSGDRSGFLDLLLVWYRDVLVFKASGDEDLLIFAESAQRLKEQAFLISYPGLENIVHAIDTALVRLRANVNYNFTMKLLIFDIKENLK